MKKVIIQAVNLCTSGMLSQGVNMTHGQETGLSCWQTLWYSSCENVTLFSCHSGNQSQGMRLQEWNELFWCQRMTFSYPEEHGAKPGGSKKDSETASMLCMCHKNWHTSDLAAGRSINPAKTIKICTNKSPSADPGANQKREASRVRIPHMSRTTEFPIVRKSTSLAEKASCSAQVNLSNTFCKAPSHDTWSTVHGYILAGAVEGAPESYPELIPFSFRLASIEM